MSIGIISADIKKVVKGKVIKILIKAGNANQMVIDWGPKR